MQLIGVPMTVQNTDSGDWIINMDNVVPSTDGQRIAITVAVRRDPYATLPDVQRKAIERAVALLQEWLAHSQ